MSNWFEIEKLPQDVYAICEPHDSEDVKSFLIIGSERALLFDTGMGRENIKDEVEKLWQGELVVVNSHSHFDHVGDNWRFPVVYGAPGENADLVAREGSERLKIKPYSREIVSDSYVFDLGNRRLEVIYTPGHSNDCIMLHDLDYKVLFVGDSYYNGPLFVQMDDPQFGRSSLEGYWISMEKVLKRCDDIDYVYSSHNEIMVNKEKLTELRNALYEIRRGTAIGKEVSGTTYNYYGDPQPLLKYQFDDFYVIVDAASMEVRNRARLALREGGYTCYIIKGHEIYTSHHRGVKPLLDWLDAGTDLRGGIAADKVIGKAAAFLYVLLGVSYVYAGVISKPALGVFEKYDILCEYEILVDAIQNRTKDGFCPMERTVWNIETPDGVPALLKDALKNLVEEAKYRERLKSMPICQIEDARAAFSSELEMGDGELDLEKLRRQMELLDAEKQRRGYKLNASKTVI
ncbi:MAG: DUF1893 domain-containing protein [Firmicutes bacterium]|nr:DUF1893 domain-containing protein [Bacillota bacterium]